MHSTSADQIVVFVTCPPYQAKGIASRLVEERLVACVNILPAIRSIYSWEGKTCDDREALLIMKTRASLFERLRLRVVELHPYEVPEVIAMPIAVGHPPYLQWLDESTQAWPDAD